MTKVVIEVGQGLADHLKLWEDSGIPAPANELQSIQAWLRSLNVNGLEETRKRMRERMVLLVHAASSIHKAGAAAEDALGIYENVPRKETNMSTSEQQLEQEIQAKGLNAPRLTPAIIDSLIGSKSFTMMPSGRCMVCELTLKSGPTFYGMSIVASPENFDFSIGEKVSFENARDEVWAYEGSKLRERIVAAEVTKTVE